jgi:hypothetical protein
MTAEFKIKAIELRKTGFSYSQILEKVPVAKSTLSLWLREVGLSKQQKQRLTNKKIAAALRGAMSRKRQRIQTQERIFASSENEIGKITPRELWLLGIALYWAEGSKEKECQPGSGVRFTNSDPLMVRLFLRWLIEICKIEESRIQMNLYIHENSKNSVSDAVVFWSKQTGFNTKEFKNIYFKRSKMRTVRQNTGNSYYGILRICVFKSSELNRKITGWIRGIVK